MYYFYHPHFMWKLITEPLVRVCPGMKRKGFNSDPPVSSLCSELLPVTYKLMGNVNGLWCVHCANAPEQERTQQRERF